MSVLWQAMTLQNTKGDVGIRNVFGNEHPAEFGVETAYAYGSSKIGLYSGILCGLTALTS